jgi:hypothetical protein
MTHVDAVHVVRTAAITANGNIATDMLNEVAGSHG